MIRNADDSTLSAIRRLKMDPDFQTFLGWLGRERDHLFEILLQAEGVKASRLQGSCLTLQTILNTNVEGADSIARLRTKGR